jgi:hypothetical protein
LLGTGVRHGDQRTRALQRRDGWGAVVEWTTLGATVADKESVYCPDAGKEKEKEREERGRGAPSVNPLIFGGPCYYRQPG